MTDEQAPAGITFDVADRIATITINSPRTRNAMTRAMIESIAAFVEEADERTDVSVVILQGAGADFSSGYDLSGSYGGVSGAAANRRSRADSVDDDSWHLERIQRLSMSLLDSHKPIVAKLRGYCLAGGTDLAFYCDLVIASHTARIGFPATRANGTPVNHMWVYNVGPQWAKRFLFTGDTITGRDAATIGLVLESVEDDELDGHVDSLARRIALIDTDLLSAHKRAVNLALELAGARTLQRLTAELDARTHGSAGPRRSQFRKDAAELGIRAALKNRDEPFGDSIIRVSR